MPSVVSCSQPIRDQLLAQMQAVVAGNRKIGIPSSWPTGIPSLDQVIGGGILRGRITELTGPLATGKSALMRQVVSRLLAAGNWVAWIDASRTLAPAPWTRLGNRFIVIRLPAPQRAAWTADLLLRSGVFGLVVIDGAPQLSRVHGVRLAQLARERDVACVVLEHAGTDESGSRLTGTVRLRIDLRYPEPSSPSSSFSSPFSPSVSASLATRDVAASTAATPTTVIATARMRITVEKGGLVTERHSVIEVERVIDLAHRLYAHPEIPDRRGVARSTRRPWLPLDSEEHRVSTPVSGGGIGVVTHDLYGIGVPGPVHFASEQRRSTDQRGDSDTGRITKRASERTSERVPTNPQRINAIAKAGTALG